MFHGKVSSIKTGLKNSLKDLCNRKFSKKILYFDIIADENQPFKGTWSILYLNNI